MLIVPLGGTDRVGMNCTLVGHAGKWIMIDAGATFAGSDDDSAAAFGDYFGGEVQQIVPDFRTIRGIMQRLTGIVITHAHEDHIGAIPALNAFKQAWPGLENVPIHASGYACGVIRRKLLEQGVTPRINRLHARKMQRIGPFEIMPINVTHSAPETFMLAIRTAVGTIVFGSDSKLDPTPVLGRPTDMQALTALGDHGVLAYLGDSTNATREGRSTSESTVARNIASIMQRHRGRVVVSTFASNLARIVGVIKAADQSGRMIAGAGRTIFNNIETALESRLLTKSDRIDLVEPWAVQAQKRHRQAFVCTGTQAEQGSALHRAVEELERGQRSGRIVLEPGDLVIHSARTIPGNEETVKAMFDTMRKHGVEVMDPDNAPLEIHASGHGKRGEIEDFYAAIRPRFAIPVHGHGELTDAHADIARSMKGVQAVSTPHEGEIMRLTPNGMSIVGRIDAGSLAVISQDGRNSGKSRLVGWRSADDIDMLHSNPPRQYEESRRRNRPQEATAPAMAR